MATSTVNAPGYQVGADDDEDQRNRERELQLQQNQEANRSPGVQDEKAIAPDDSPQPIEQAPEPISQPPAPAAQQPSGQGTFQPSDIANVMVDAHQNQQTGDYATPAGDPVSGAAPALPADQDPDVLALMQSRYHSDPAQVAAQLAAATGGPSTATSEQLTTAGNLTGQPTTPGAPTMESILQNRLIELMGRSATPNANDPEIATTLQAADLAGQRAFDRNSADLAERAAFNGQSGSGAAEAGRAALRQAQGESQQKIAAGVYQDAANRRIAELQNTLQTAGSLLSEKDKNALQLQITKLQRDAQVQIAGMNDATNRYGISEGGRQFDAGLAEKIRQYGLDAAARDAAQGAASSAAGSANDERRYEFDKNFGLDERQQGFLEDKWATSQNADPVLAFLRSNGYLE